MTTTDENKRIVDEFIQALFTRGDLTAVDHYLAEDFVAHDPPMVGVSGDATGFRDAAVMIRAALPDWRSDVHLLVAEGDWVVERFTASGTHRGEFLGAAPTNRRVAMPGINIFRLRDGKIVERWGNLDVLGFLTQLGVVRCQQGHEAPRRRIVESCGRRIGGTASRDCGGSSTPVWASTSSAPDRWGVSGRF